MPKILYCLWNRAESCLRAHCARSKKKIGKKIRNKKSGKKSEKKSEKNSEKMSTKKSKKKSKTCFQQVGRVSAQKLKKMKALY